MLRRLLTLLALCAGLVAAGEPARAAVGPAETVHLVERAGLACAARNTLRSSEAQRNGQWREARGQRCPKPIALAPVPTVRLQVDRARE